MRVVSGSLQGLLGAGRHHGRDQLEAEARGWSRCSRTCWAAELGPWQQSDEPRSATTHHEVLPIAPFLQRPLPALWLEVTLSQENTTRRDFKHDVSSAKRQRPYEWHSPFCNNVFSCTSPPQAPPPPQSAVTSHLHDL